MPDDRIDRPNYYDGQRLGANDFLDEQRYHRDALRRHQLGPHTWGIVAGLELIEEPVEGGATGEVRVTLTPGYAMDGYGRMIVVFYPYELPLSLIEGSTGTQPLWIGHDESPRAIENDPCAGSNVERIRETFRVRVGHTTDREPQRDDILVGDETIQSPAAATLPADLGLGSDLSVPHQRLPAAAGATWWVRLGTVVTGSGRFRESPTARAGRELAGVVAASIAAPERELRLVERYRGPHDSPATLGVYLEGNLIVEKSPAGSDSGGAGTFHGDVRLDGSSLVLRDSRGNGEELSIARSATEADEAHLDLRIGAAPDGLHCLRVGPDSEGRIDPVLSVCNTPLVTVHGPMNVEEALTASTLQVAETVSVGESLHVEGETELAGRVTAQSALEVSHTLRVEGVAELVGGMRGNLLNLDFALHVELATDLPLDVSGAYRRIAAELSAQAMLRRASQAVYLEINTRGPAGRISPVVLSLRPTAREDARRIMKFNGPLAHHVWLLKPTNITEPFEYKVEAPADGSMTMDVNVVGIL